MKPTLRIAAALSLGTMAPPASAAVTFTFAQVGNDVVLTGSGSLNLAKIVFLNQSDFIPNVSSARGELAVGLAGRSLVSEITGGSGVFGSGQEVTATSSSGDMISINYSVGEVAYPLNYRGGALIGTATFAGQTFQSLGLIAGNYLYTIPSDTITVIVPVAVTPAAVPETATWAMMMAGLSAIGLVMRHRRRIASVTQAPACAT